jgi:hypothetical protein
MSEPSVIGTLAAAGSIEPPFPFVAIPITLSAAEFMPAAGVSPTNAAR